jgi:hypothetical protein
MVEPSACESKARDDVVAFEVRQFLEQPCRGQARSEQVEHVSDPDPQAADARTSSALTRVDRDPFGKYQKGLSVPGTLLCARPVLILPTIQRSSFSAASARRGATIQAMMMLSR